MQGVFSDGACLGWTVRVSERDASVSPPLPLAGQMTEIIEPSETVPAEAVQGLLRQIQAKLHTYKGVALCGTYPPGVTESFYPSISSWLAPHTLLLLDGYRGVDAVLNSGRVDGV